MPKEGESKGKAQSASETGEQTTGSGGGLGGNRLGGVQDVGSTDETQMTKGERHRSGQD